MSNCAPAAVADYVPSSERPWNHVRAVHLLRRMSFGASVPDVLSALDRAPTVVVDESIAAAKALPLTPEPIFATKDQTAYILALLESTLEKNDYARQWIIDLQKNGLRGRLAFFWHNHFVTRFDTHESSSYTYQYHKLLQEYALGDFRAFVRVIGLTPAMLVFLNGSENKAGSPNENYARELFELFTLGVDNGYTQQDIKETARALTGYTDVPVAWGPINFDPATYDAGEKTIFGRTGNWGYDDVIDLLFEERPLQISRFMAGKFYRRFVNPEPNEEVIDHLAEVFRDSDWDISALIAALFKSEHFFDEANIATIIEGPLEDSLIFYNELGNQLDGLNVFGVWAGAEGAGQQVFSPVDVAGWPGNRSWINTTSIAQRWNIYENQLGTTLIFGFGRLGDMARSITKETQDVEVICRDLIEYFLPKGLQFPGDFEAALLNFKGDTPPEYFTNGIWDINYWTVPIQVRSLLGYLTQLPEFQLK